MPRFLCDEDLPRSLALTLRSASIDAVDLRDVGLRGCADEAVLDYATREGRAVITADVGFGSVLRFPLGKHPGIIVARFPNEISVPDLNAALLAAIVLLKDDEVAGNIIVIAPGRIRIRRSLGL